MYPSNTPTPPAGHVVYVERMSRSDRKLENLLFDPTSDVIYPGTMLDGATIRNGEYQPIVLPRSGMTVSTSFQNLNTASAKVDASKWRFVSDGNGYFYIKNSTTGESNLKLLNPVVSMPWDLTMSNNSTDSERWRFIVAQF